LIGCRIAQHEADFGSTALAVSGRRRATVALDDLLND
jgi:hypothetical protein